MCLLQAAPSSGEGLSVVECQWTLAFWGWVTGLFFGLVSFLEKVLSIYRVQVQKPKRLRKRDMGAAASQLPPPGKSFSMKSKTSAQAVVLGRAVWWGTALPRMCVESVGACACRVRACSTRVRARLLASR